MKIEIKADIESLVAVARDTAVTRKPLRKALREAAKLVKVEATARARAISKRLARRMKVKVDRATVPRYALVSNSYAGAHAIESGRRAGAKAPPVEALRGGWPAARAVARTGIPARPFMAPAAAASAGAVARRLATAGQEMEAAWSAAKAKKSAKRG